MCCTVGLCKFEFGNGQIWLSVLAFSFDGVLGLEDCGLDLGLDLDLDLDLDLGDRVLVNITVLIPTLRLSHNAHASEKISESP